MKIFQIIFIVAAGLFSPVVITIFIESVGPEFIEYSMSTKVISIILCLILYAGLILVISKKLK